MTPDDVARARELCATDVEIHDTVLIAAAFCMFSRYVDGLGTSQPRDEAMYRERGKWIARDGYLNVSKEYLTAETVRQKEPECHTSHYLKDYQESPANLLSVWRRRSLCELAHVLLHGENSLSPGECELIATYVSSRNDCYFCQTSHGAAAAAHLAKDWGLVDRVKRDCARGVRVLTRFSRSARGPRSVALKLPRHRR